MAPSLADIVSELKSLKDAIHENAEKAAMKEDLSDLKSFIMLGIIERQNVTIESLENKMISLEDELLQIKDKLNEREASPSHNISAHVHCASRGRGELWKMSW